MIKSEFPALRDNQIVYLDSAATAMRPQCVIDEISRYYACDSANPHRGLYDMSQRATASYDGAREVAAAFIGAGFDETIFVRNTSEALNLIAYCYAPIVLHEGDNVVIPITEHHSNLVTWQFACKKAKAELRFLYVDNNTGEIPDAEIATKIDSRTRIIAFAHVTNVLGTVNPVEKLVAAAKKAGAVTVLDIAQSVPHMEVNVKALGVDFAAFSGHKLYGPMGIGVLYGRRELLETMPPFLYGGDMIEDVLEQETVFGPLPVKFEAGTQNGAGAAGLAAAIKFVKAIGYEQIERSERLLMQKLTRELRQLPHISITCDTQGMENSRHAVVSFSVDDVHPHDVSTVLNESRIAVRAGKHCAHPLLAHLGVPFRATVRASLGVYTDENDIAALIEALPKVRRILGYAD